MSTRAHVIVKDESDKKYLYHHCDGYPDGVGEDLESFIIDIGGADLKSAEIFCNMINDWDPAFEIDNGIHGDEEYIYVVDLPSRKYFCYEVTGYNASESDLDKYNKVFEREWKDSSRLYKHIKTGKIYSLITDNFMFKDNGVWREGLILYKAEYDNPVGEYFAREADDFYKKFEKL